MEGMGSRAPYTPLAKPQQHWRWRDDMMPGDKPPTLKRFCDVLRKGKLQKHKSWKSINFPCLFRLSTKMLLAGKILENISNLPVHFRRSYVKVSHAWRFFLSDFARLKFVRIWRGTKLPNARWSFRRVGPNGRPFFVSRGGKHDFLKIFLAGP